MFNRIVRRLFVIAVALTVVSCSKQEDGTAGDAPAPTTRQSTTDSTQDTPAESRAVVAERLPYGEVDEKLVSGHFVFPEDMIEPLPAVVLIHEWWGLNENIRGLADRLASEGFIVLAVDLFQGQTAASLVEARQLMVEVLEDTGLIEENIRQASDWLKTIAGSPSVAVVGYGLGGTWSLNSASQLGDELDAAVIYYGQVTDNEEVLAAISVPVLAFFGGRDTLIPAESIEAFEAAMTGLEKEVRVETYAQGRSSFASPGNRNFTITLAERSWETTIEFLREHLVFDAQDQS